MLVRAVCHGGVVVVGAGLSIVTPIASVPDVGVASPAVRLASADSMLNIPVNLFTDIIDIPYNEISAVQQVADALDTTGSWFLYSPTNIWGLDPGDWDRMAAAAALMVPFPQLSEPLSENLNIIAASELPMNAGCPYITFCPDTGALLSNFFQVPLQKLLEGYTFPTVTDPFNGSEVPWSGQTVQLDLSKSVTDFFNGLMADPSANPIRLPTLDQSITAFSHLIQALYLNFNPFVPGELVIQLGTASGVADAADRVTHASAAALDASVLDPISLDPSSRLAELGNPVA